MTKREALRAEVRATLDALRTTPYYPRFAKPNGPVKPSDRRIEGPRFKTSSIIIPKKP